MDTRKDNFIHIPFKRSAAILMHKYGAHGATDVSKFGLLGHAAGLVKAQASEVRYNINFRKAV